MRIAILGAGAMGTALGAHLARKGIPIDLIDPYEAHVKKLNQDGARVTGCDEFVVPVHALTPDQMTDTYDLVFLLIKQTRNEENLQKLLPHLAENGTVCTLQNGVPEPAVAKLVGELRTVGGACLWGAIFVAPGVVNLTTPLSSRPTLFEIGEPYGQATDRIKMVGDVLSHMGHAEIEDNFMGARWLKLMLNCSMSGLSAALGTPYQDVLNSDKAMTCLSYLASEVVQVSRAAGVHIKDVNGLNTAEIADFTTASELERSKGYLYRNYYPLRSGKASMLQDLERGVKTEINVINGFVCSAGEKYGVPTPFNDKVVELITCIENGTKTLDFAANLACFEIPPL